MNLTLAPQGDTLTALKGWLRTQFASIAAGWATEHNADGTHDWGWTTPAFDANRFQGDGTITWTVASADRIFEEYGMQGDLMKWTLQLAATTTGGTASTELRVTLPDGYRLTARAFLPAGYASDNSSDPGVVFLEGATGARYLAVKCQDGGTWSNASTNATYLYFSVWLRVTRD